MVGERNRKRIEETCSKVVAGKMSKDLEQIRSQIDLNYLKPEVSQALRDEHEFRRLPPYDEEEVRLYNLDSKKKR